MRERSIFRGPIAVIFSEAKNLLLYAWIAVNLAILFAALGQAQAPEQLLQQADQDLQKQDYLSAAKVLETYLVHQPDDFRAEFNLAYAYSFTGRRAEAIEHYKKVLTREPDLASAHLNVGILLLQEGHAAEAEDHLRNVLKQQPDNANAAFQLATALASLKRLPEAADFYERVLKVKPDDAPAHFAYGMALAESNHAAAEEHLRRAVQIDPSLEDAWLGLATLLESTSGSGDRQSEAAEIYRQYLAKHPDRKDIRIHLGEIHFAQRQFAAAAEDFEAARAGDSSMPLAKQLLQTYLNILQIETAQSGGRQRLQARLDNPNIQRSTAGGDEKTRNKAITLVTEILAQDGHDPEMHLLSGRLRMEQKEYRLAAEEFRQVTELQPQSPGGYTNWASALYLTGDCEATIGALAKISELRQDTAGSYFLRAICLDKLHVLKPALENYQHFLSVDGGANPDQEFQARQRSKLLDREIRKGIPGHG